MARVAAPGKRAVERRAGQVAIAFKLLPRIENDDAASVIHAHLASQHRDARAAQTLAHGENRPLHRDQSVAGRDIEMMPATLARRLDDDGATPQFQSRALPRGSEGKLRLPAHLYLAAVGQPQQRI